MPPAPLHRRRSVRLPVFDYRTAGAYFVTACTHGRAPVLARVTPHGVRLSGLGRIVADEWRRLPLRRLDVRCDTFVVMPDHVHFVVWIDAGASGGGGTMNCAPTPRRFADRLGGSLDAVVALFKAGVTRRVNERRMTPGAPFWQRGFYEHVVRGPDDLARIRRYIDDNPARWWAQQGLS